MIFEEISLKIWVHSVIVSHICCRYFYIYYGEFQKVTIHLTNLNFDVEKYISLRKYKEKSRLFYPPPKKIILTFAYSSQKTIFVQIL